MDSHLRKIRRPSSFKCPVLFSGAFLTLSLGLSAHVFMMTVLHVPYPYKKPPVDVLVFVNDMTVTATCMAIYRLSPLFLSRANLAVRISLLFLLATTMTEHLLRTPLMNGFVTTAWLYAAIENAPKLAAWLALACLVVASTPFVTNWRRGLLVVLGVTGVTFLALAPIFSRLYAPVLDAAAKLQHDPVYGFPYGWQVTTAAYVTYVEPVAACLIAAALVWPRLPGGVGSKIAAMTLLIVMIRGSLLGLLAYAAYHKDQWVKALASDGQFAFESLVLGLLTSLTWRYACRTRPPPGVNDGAVL